jgi:DNA-directed RNA polymerase specialized sigma24 family protein
MGDLRQLVQRTIAGDGLAWRELQAEIGPTIGAIACRHPGMRQRGLSALPDDIAEITTASLERLARSDFQNLKRYIERKPAEASQPNSFDGWLYGAVEYVIRDHLRRRYGRAPRIESGEALQVQPSRRDLQSHAGRLADGGIERSFLVTVGMTAKLTAAQIFAHIERDFAADEARAMRLYYAQDCSFEEIAQELALPDGKSAERMIRRLNARLRYRFLAEEKDGQANG